MIRSIHSVGKAALERGAPRCAGQRAHGVLPAWRGWGDRRPRGASYVRVSCAHRWRPWGQAHPDLRQGPGEVHHASLDAWQPQVDPGLHETPVRHTSACGDGRPPSDVGVSQRGDAIDRACCAVALLPGGSLTIRLQAAGRTEDAGHGCGVSAAAGPQPWLSPSEGERLRARAHHGQACLITARHGSGTMG